MFIDRRQATTTGNVFADEEQESKTRAGKCHSLVGRLFSRLLGYVHSHRVHTLPFSGSYLSMNQSLKRGNDDDSSA